MKSESLWSTAGESVGASSSMSSIDEQLIAKTLVLTLKSAGYEAQMFFNGESALHAISVAEARKKRWAEKRTDN